MQVTWATDATAGLIEVGDRARNVRVIGNNLSPVLPLARSQGKIRLFRLLPGYASL